MTPSGPARDGRQARWVRHNEERRLGIIAAALEVLEDAGPGAEIHVQQIADRAGLNRTVVYRHFADRADLDRAVQDRILADLTAQVLPEIDLDGTINEIIGRIVSTYVAWVTAHPALHHFAETEGGPFEHGIQQIAGTVVEILTAAIELLGVELRSDERAAVDPLGHAIVGAVLGAVRRWVAREPREPAAARMGELISESVWHLVDGHARRLGLHLDPDVPLEQLLDQPEPEAVP